MMLEQPIAIVGMSCRLPQAASPRKFWNNLLGKHRSILRLVGAQQAGMQMAVGYLEDADLFDPTFFRIGKREAALIDPQHRLFLGCAREVLEQVPQNARHDQRVGVFTSCPMNTYLPYTKPRVDTSLHTLEGLQATLQNDKDYLALRTAHALNLTGPAVDLQSSCSSSAVAVHLACRALAAGDCHLAVVGGATLMVPQLRPYKGVEGSIFSLDGQCQPFTDQANGTVHGNGAAAIALKRLDDAINDENPIFGVIISSAVNNNGNRQDSFTAPSPAGWCEVIGAGLDGIDVHTIGLVEAHGTGTRLGDRTELQALQAVFGGRTDKKAFCALGTAKSHIGHLEAISAVVGIIKVAMSLVEGRITSDRYHDETLAMHDSPFYFPGESLPWPDTGNSPRRACVNSSGMGGTNVHLVIEAPPKGLVASLPDAPAPTANQVRCWTVAPPLPAHQALGLRLADEPDGPSIYELALNRAAHEWIVSHTLGGTAMLPGTYFISLLRAAADSVAGHQTPYTLTEVAFTKPLLLTPQKVTLRTLVRQTGQGWSIQIESRTSSSWESVIHAAAQVSLAVAAAPAAVQLSELLRGEQIPQPMQGLYAAPPGNGLYHGAHFQKLRHVVQTPAGMLAVVADFEQQLKQPVDRQVCLLDACLQSFRFAHGLAQGSPYAGFLLTEIEAIELSALAWQPGQALWCLVRRREESVGNLFVSDFLFFSEDGSPMGHVLGARERGLLANVQEPLQAVAEPAAVQAMASAGDTAGERSNLHALVRSLIADAMGRDSAAIAGSDTLDSLGFDSFSTLELSLAIEEQLQRKIDPDAIGKTQTVDDIVLILMARPDPVRG